MDVREKPVLSETEEVLYHYLCFLHLSKFWSEVEKIRNINHVERPLFITDFIERIDQTADVNVYIERTRELCRQTFLVYPHISPSTHITKIEHKQVVNIGGYYE